MDHKYYYQTLEQLGRNAVVELRQLDARQAIMHKEYLDQRINGDITERGYNGLVKSLQDSRQRVLDRYKADIATLEEKYGKAVEEYMTPSAGRMHPEDIEVLKSFALSSAEFDAMAEKYRDNPTMGRLLEDYRKEHDIKTEWRFQSLDARKAAFSSACSSAESIMGQLDKYCPDREGNVTRSVFGYYHKLQDSDPDALPVPPEEVQSGTYMIGGVTASSGAASGRTLF